MKNKSLIRIINEEISGFDFLGNEKYVKEEEDINLLKNKDFQKQFICDLLLKRKEKVKTIQVAQSDFGDNWERNGYLTIDYIIEFAYTYDVAKQPARFGIQLKGDRIQYNINSVSTQGKWMGTMPDSTPPSGGEWFDEIDWDAIKVSMFMIDERDDDVEFLAFESAPPRIQHLFIKEIVGDFIREWAGPGMGTPADYDSAAKAGYCPNN
jgi:hypothetical protein